mgnify:CR=1 FL=1
MNSQPQQIRTEKIPIEEKKFLRKLKTKNELYFFFIKISFAALIHTDGPPAR